MTRSTSAVGPGRQGPREGDPSPTGTHAGTRVTEKVFSSCWKDHTLGPHCEMCRRAQGTSRLWVEDGKAGDSVPPPGGGGARLHTRTSPGGSASCHSRAFLSLPDRRSLGPGVHACTRSLSKRGAEAMRAFWAG